MLPSYNLQKIRTASVERWDHLFIRSFLPFYEVTVLINIILHLRSSLGGKKTPPKQHFVVCRVSYIKKTLPVYPIICLSACQGTRNFGFSFCKAIIVNLVHSWDRSVISLIQDCKTCSGYAPLGIQARIFLLLPREPRDWIGNFLLAFQTHKCTYTFIVCDWWIFWK